MTKMTKPTELLHPEQLYIDVDPYSSDRDCCIIRFPAKVVKTRKRHQCTSPVKKNHRMPKGTHARYEKAIVDESWGSYYVCVECMDEYIKEKLNDN